MVLFVVKMFRNGVLAVVFAMALSPKPALAEIDLGTWQTHAAMAEQGAVCGAFADLMAMQSLVDEKVGRLWSERRAYSGSVVRRAAELEGRTDADNEAIDDLLNRYSMWLLNNLANTANAEILDPVARDAASNMIGDVCAGLYAQADRAILKKHPSLGACSPGQTPLTALSATPPDDKPATCEGDSAIIAATTIKQAEDTVADMLRRLQKTQARADDLSTELAILQIDHDRLLREIDANRIVTTKVDDLTAANNQLRAEISGLRAERDRLAATAADLQSLKQENSTLIADSASLKQTLAGEIESGRQRDAEFRDLQARHHAGLERIESLTGELAAAKAVMNAAPTSEDLEKAADELARTRETLRDITAERDRMAVELAMATATLETRTGTGPDQTAANRDFGTDTVARNELALLDTESGTQAARNVVAQPDAEAERNVVAELGAFSSRTGALSEISRIQTSFPDMSALTALTIMPSQRDDGSSIFRITTARMPAEDAQDLCGELWDGMVSCMVRAAP